MPNRETWARTKSEDFDVHDDVLAARHQEPIGADDRGTLHQRIEGQGLAVRRGIDVELGEVREFLRPVGDGDVERDAPSGEAVLPQFADCAEIGGPEKGDPVVLAPVERSVARFLDPHASEARARRQLTRRRIGRHFEIGLLVDDLARLVAFDHVHADGLLEEEPEMKERDRKWPGTIGEQRIVVAIADLAPFLVIDPLQDVRRGARRRLIGRMRALACLRLEEFVGEGDGRLELQAVGLSSKSFAHRTHRRRSSSDAFENRPTIDAIRHDCPFETTTW